MTSLIAVLLLGLGLQDAPISLEARAVPASEVVASIAKQSGQKLATGQEISRELVVARFTDQPLSQVKARFEELFEATWTAEPDGTLRLQPTPEQRTAQRLRKRELALRRSERLLADFKKQWAKTPKPTNLRKYVEDQAAAAKSEGTPITPSNFALSAPSAPAAMAKAIDPRGESEDLPEMPSPGRWLLGQFAAQLSPAVLADSMLGNRKVYSDRPNALQTLFPGSIVALANQNMSLMRQIILKVTGNGIFTSGFGADEEGNQIPGSPIRIDFNRIFSPASRLLIVLQNSNLSLRLVTTEGKVLQFEDLELGGDEEDPDGEFEKLSKDQTQLEVDERVRSLVTDTRMVPAQWMPTFLKPEEIEPMSLLPAEALFAVSKLKRKPSLSVAPDLTPILCARSSQLTLANFRISLISDYDWRESASWLVVRPKDPATFRVNHFPRTQLGQWARKWVKGETATVEEGLALEGVAAQSFFPELYAGVIGFPGSCNRPNGPFAKILRIFGARRTSAAGVTVREIPELGSILFPAILNLQEGFEGDGSEMSYTSLPTQFEPTEVLARGLPPETRISVTEEARPTVCRQVQGRISTADASVTAYASSRAGTNELPPNFQFFLATTRSVKVKVQLPTGPSFEAEFTQRKINIDQPVTFNQLPEAWRKAFRTSLDEINADKTAPPPRS